MKRVIGLALALSCLAAPLWAQANGGNIYGTVSDASGAVLPGVTVTLASGFIAARSATSGPMGEFRFLNLDPGSYKLSISLSGFASIDREVIVTTGQNVNLSFSMNPAQLEEKVTVTAETPVVDTKRVGTATTMSKEELAQVPQSRDPWAVLKTVPGVLVDRVNVAGNESGQQSGFAGKGSQAADTMWNLDGVVITDTTSGGASSSYFDFDAFDEINVTTGGGDLKVQTGGLGINFVTKRGTNAYHASLRGFMSNHKLQSNNTPSSLLGDARLGGNDEANHTDQIWDWGAEVSGPIVKDKLWFWGSYGKNDIRIARLTQTKDKTLLKNWNAKLNWQAGPNDMVSVFWFNGAKEKFGRSPGQASTEADSFLWNQGNFYPEQNCGVPCGMHGLWKAEWNHTFNSNFFITTKYAYYGWGYGFDPRGGDDKDGGIDLFGDAAYGSWFKFTARKPWHIAQLDGSYFQNATGGQHEFKFGFSYRRNPNKTTTTWSGSQIVANQLEADGSGVAKVYRQRNVEFLGENLAAYVGDTFTRGRLTVNAGVRWDEQKSKNNPSTAQANPTFPNLLPTLSYDGNGPTIDWKDISPRVSLSYALDANRKSVLRASYARYAGQLNPFEVTSASPVGGYYTYLAYKWVDRNGDHFAQRDEILLGDGVQYANNVDPRNPSSASAVNTIDPNYHANKDDEVVVGIDHELAPNFGVGVAYTWHRVGDLPSWNPRIGLTEADYSVANVANQGPYSATTFAPNGDLIDAFAGGRVLTNRPNYHTGYSGFELTAFKRLSNKWMFRAALSWMDWKEYYDGPGAVQNPTRTDTTAGGTLSGPIVDGGQVAPRSGGSGKGDIFYNGKWQVTANALYQLPAGFELAASLLGRQGYTRPLVFRLGAGGDGNVRVLATPNIDDNRYDPVWDFDFRLAKNLKVGGDHSLNISLDLFNAFNNNVTLAAGRQINSGTLGAINEVLSPRILRVGLRYQF
jgi:hypothetical protein